MNLSLRDHQSDAGVGKWIGEVGVTDAPMTRRNIRTALAFFATCMPSLSPQMAANFLRAMDLSRAVSALTLKPGDPLVAFRVGNESPFKLFFTRSGSSAHSSGLNPVGRSIARFKVRTHARALESYTTGTIDVWTLPGDHQPLTVAPRANTTGVMVAGGGIQLIVPRSFTVLQVA
jgi:hypothetical protein